MYANMQSYESNPSAKHAMVFPRLAKLQIGQRITITKPLLELSADTLICRLKFSIDWAAITGFIPFEFLTESIRNHIFVASTPYNSIQRCLPVSDRTILENLRHSRSVFHHEIAQAYISRTYIMHTCFEFWVPPTELVLRNSAYAYHRRRPRSIPEL
jgi:hypothetical protein